MVVTCCVPGCKLMRFRDQQDRRISYHQFPQKEHLRRAWLRAINRKTPFNINTSKVCSKHFTDEDFIRNVKSGRRFLCTNAVPSVFLAPPGKWANGLTVHKPPTSDGETEPTGDYHGDKPFGYASSEPTCKAPQDTFVPLGHVVMGTDAGEHMPLALTYQIVCQSEVPVKTEPNCTSEEALCEDVLQVPKVEYTEYELQVRVGQLEGELHEAKQNISVFEEQLSKLQRRCSELESIRSVFSVERFKDDRADFQFYTSLPSYEVFKAILQYLGPGDKGSNIDFRMPLDDGPPTPLPLDVENQFFLVLTKLKLGLFTRDLAYRFLIEESAVNRIFNGWINFMFQRLTMLPLWGSREAVDRKMPPEIAKKFPKFRAAIAVTEIGYQLSGASIDKMTSTLKGMIGMSPDGLVSFVSPLFLGGISNRDLVRDGGFLELQFDAGDCVIAGRDLLVADILQPLNVKLSIPPLEKTQSINQGVAEVQRIALERIQNRLERIKSFHIFDRWVPLDILPLVDRIWTVCCVLTNFQGRRS